MKFIVLKYCHKFMLDKEPYLCKISRRTMTFQILSSRDSLTFDVFSVIEKIVDSLLSLPWRTPEAMKNTDIKKVG